MRTFALFGQIMFGGLCGLEYIAILAGESRQPARTIGQSVWIASPIICGMFVMDFWFHDLRHTFASWYMMNGGDLYELAKLLGHASIKMTERYAKLARAHITKTGNTAKVIWTMLD